MPAIDTPDLMTAGETARLLGLSVERVRQLADTDRLPPAHFTGLGRLFARPAVERFLAEREQAGPKPRTRQVRGVVQEGA